MNSSFKKDDKVLVIRGKYKGLEGYFLSAHQDQEGMCWVDIQDPEKKKIKSRNGSQDAVLSFDQIAKA